MNGIEFFEHLEILSRFFLFVILSMYVMQNLQWYNYSITRVITKHHKINWHLYYFLLPIVVYLIFDIFDIVRYYWFLFYILYVPMFFRWFYKLDKKLILTKRIQRYIFTSITLFTILLFICPFTLLLLVGLVGSFILNNLIEKIIFLSYKKMAIKKINSKKDLIVIAITASYGKTSIKNYLYQLLSRHKRVYTSLISVNTEIGIIQDINNNLLDNIDIYIVEAGARNRGDIKKIIDIVNPTYVILGKIGNQHIEYFGDIKNIIKTKSEILKSKNIKKAFIHNDNKKLLAPKDLQMDIVWYLDDVVNMTSTLDGISFDMKINNIYKNFNAPILGEFNCHNLAAVICVGIEFKLKVTQIDKILKKLKPVKNRLQLLQKSPKVIIDDSYNSNLEGMKQAIKLCKTYDGRKVIVTPGLVECDEESNIQIAKIIDEVFDMAIITGDLNSKLISSHLKHTHKMILKNKQQLESILQFNTKNGDLILFANDAPNFI